MELTKSTKLNFILNKIRKGCQLIKKQKTNIKKIIFIILILTMLWLIYQVSPRITNVIQNIAKYLYEIDSIYITRVVEILLVISFIAPFKKEGGEK